MADYLGQQLGKYRLTRLLGAGGFAEVYLGVHVHLGTEAAIKLLHAQLVTPADAEKFRQEARTIAALVHPNIVRVLDFDIEGNIPYLVLDYAPNGSLRQHLPSGTPLPPASIVPYLMQVADALQYAHEQKLIHRDIKPENMLLGRRGEVLLTDFGIATVAQSTSMQKTQGVAGTAAYMSPEQLQGKPRPASDLYSLGVVVYEWLVGERPFQGGFTEVASQHLFTPPPPLREKAPTISPEIEQVVLTALAKDPKERFGSVRAFANAFAQASGAGATLGSFSTRMASPAPGTPGSTAQDYQPGTTVTAGNQLTPHITPQLTPQVSAATPPAQLTPSILDAPTQLTPPAAGTPFVVGGSGPSSAVSPLASVGAGSTIPGYAPPGSASGPATYIPPGWAATAGASRTAENDTLLTNLPSAPGAPIVPQGSSGGQPRRRRWGMLALAAVVVLALLSGGVAYAFLGGLIHLGQTSAGGTSAATAATVTITPKKSDLTNTFNLTAVVGASTDASKQQVGARLLSVMTQSYSQTASATGSNTISATYARGTLTFSLDSGSPYSIPAGSVFSGTSGVAVVTDANALVTTSQPVDVAAHAAVAGSSGNIPANDINHDLCPSNCLVAVENLSAFTGGRDASTETVVRQSDIDNAANSLENQNQPNAQQLLQGQLKTGEQLVGTPQCQPNVSANHQAGDVASQVTVTVTFTCTGEAYDHDGALALAVTLLTNQAANDPGSGYALVGNIRTSLLSAAISDNQGTVAISVSAEGVWAYQFSDAQKQMLAAQIAGKNKQDAESLLTSQTGIAQVDIRLAGGGQTLPTDPRQISIVIQTVTGN